MNPFKPGDLVCTIDKKRINGKVKYLACGGATQAGGRICDRKSCPHNDKDFVWVAWEDKTVCSYLWDELDFWTGGISDLATEAPPPVPNQEKIELPEPSKENKEWRRSYDGFTRVVKDRSGKKYTVGEPEPEKDPIPDDQIDWEVYAGYKAGSVRKTL